MIRTMSTRATTLRGRLDEHLVESVALRSNPLGDPHERPLWVYTPPSYAGGPTVYVLQTAGPDPKDITIHYPVIGRNGIYKQVGVFKDNPNVFEVGTNLSVQFPQTSATGMFGPSTVWTQRIIAGSQPDVLARLSRYMADDECLRVRRQNKERVPWEASRDLVGSV